MTERDAASEAQIAAADPGISTWLSANAGSGKTRVLTDRVALLLLRQVPPERILCLTYTKAAASEMQNRLFATLGKWAMKDDAPLAADLEALGLAPTAIDAGLLARARTLFARAIETPGGLKIQTIHSFCSAVLRRFPLEAGVSPGFAEMDERAQLLLTGAVLDEMAEGTGRDALDGVVRYLSAEDQIARFVGALMSKRQGLEHPAEWSAICGFFGIEPDCDEARLIAETLIGGERAVCTKLAGLLDPDHRTEGAQRRRLEGIAWDAPTLDDLAELETVFLTGSETNTPDSPKIGKVPAKAKQAAMGADLTALNALMERLAVLRPRRRAYLAARRTEALHRFAAAFLPAYDAAKAARGWLDFDDLILRTCALLEDPGVAQWVLFRLDGGIDHILVDEAQDTSPQQWQIVARLSEEFASGTGARADVARTIFVVGDKKQSIYSFQGADPGGFDRMRDHFKTGLDKVDAPFQSRELVYSFRSAPPVLALVDQVFAGPAEPGVGPGVTHRAFRSDLPGRVDVWPAIEASDDPERPDWSSPVDLLPEDHHTVRLARRVAEAIATMLTDGSTIEVKGERRRVRAGDILILVQRRSDLFDEMISAIKARELPIAGADRMRLAAQLAVRDLTALLAFLATPEDDLSLAAVLRSPLMGWDERALHDLAHGRANRYLWRALQDRRAEYPDTVEMLEDLRNRADFLRPYDLLERALIRHEGRRRLLARMGNEAEDGIDAMLAQALAYERIEVPSLTGFVGWLQAGEVVIKRDPGSAGNQIRVMSIHGAKGLESPIVILPDTAWRQRNSQGMHLLAPEAGPLVWPGPKADAPDALRPLHAAREAREAEERNRLLYVAMTRAQSWLILGAAGKLETRTDKGWYRLVEDAAVEMGAMPQDFFGERGLRLDTGNWSPAPETAPSAPEPRPALPGWATAPAPDAAHPAEPLSPSDLGGAKVLPGAADALDQEAAMLRGERIHLLLEHLPDLPPAAWPAAAPAMLGLAEDAARDLLEEAARVLSTPALAHLFSGAALAEVSLTAHSATLNRQLLGQIDRLILAPDRVLAVDFKTNAAVPATPGDVPEGLLRQIGAYAEMLGATYPGRNVETAILWTRTATLMPLPHGLVMASLQRAAGA